MDTESPPVPYLPGPIGRAVRFGLGVLVFQSAVGAVLALVDGAGGAPSMDDDGLVIAVIVAAWLTPVVYDVGFQKNYGNGWRVLAVAGLGVGAGVGAVFGAVGTGVNVAVLVWITVTLGWLGVSFLLSSVLRTPGCEMRALAHLAAHLLPGDRVIVACPGPLQPLDEWEAQATGRAQPYLG